MIKNEEIKITVIVPVYNTEKYIRECINSILNQTYRNIELILIDDESKDNSYSICQEYENIDNRIILLQQKNSGAGVARNQGMEIASGDYIMFVDSDDVIDKKTLELMIEKIRAPYSEGIVIGKVCMFYEDGRKKEVFEEVSSLSFKDTDTLYNQYYFPLIKFKLNCFSVRTLYPKDLIIKEKAKFGQSTYSEDMIFLLQIAKNIKWIEVIDEPLYFWRRHTTSLTTRKYRNNFLNDSISFFIQFKKIVLELPFKEYQKNNLINYTKLRLQNELIYNACGNADYKMECKTILNSIFFEENVEPVFYKEWQKSQNIGNKYVAFLIKRKLFPILSLSRKISNN